MNRWTDDHSARLAELWPTKKTERAIAEELGFSAACISIKAAALDLPPRRGPTSARLYLLEEANKRNLTGRQLQAKIISIVLRDHMISAVLDDQMASI